MPNSLRNAAAALVLATAVRAQVYVVDGSNGPGTNFTSIAAAVAAVPDGAVLDVRAGTYGPFTIVAKGLTVAGEPGVLVDGQTTTPIRVQALAAHQTVVLRELDASQFLAPAAIACANSMGAIVLDRCRADAATATHGGRLVLTACGQVHVRDSSFYSGVPSQATVHSISSNLSLAGCSIGGFGSPLLIAGGQVDLSACSVAGVGYAPAIQLNGGDLRVRGNSTIAGSVFVGLFALAINGTGNVRLDPNTTLQNVPNPPLGPGLTVTNVSMPWLTTAPGPLGGTSTIRLFGPAGGIGALFVGFPGQPFALPGIADPVWLLPGSATPHAIGPATLTTGHMVPYAPWVRGITLAWQGVTFAASQGLQVSNPGVYAH